MKAWGKWFESIADKTADQGGHFMKGKEITKAGVKDLPVGMESITGYTVINAASFDEAEKIAKANPYVAGIRVYEIMSK